MPRFWSTYNGSLTPQDGDTVRLCSHDDKGRFCHPSIEGRVSNIEPLNVEWPADAHPSFFDVVPSNLEPHHLEVLCELGGRHA